MVFHTLKIIKVPILICLFLFLIYCSTNRKVSSKQVYSFEILFGSTGGFTNTNPVFVVKNNGEVLKKDNTSSVPYLLKRIDNQQIELLYQLIEDSNLGNLKMKQVSNITNYMEIKSEKYNNKIMWFDESQIPVEVKNLYQTLITAIKNE